MNSQLPAISSTAKVSSLNTGLQVGGTNSLGWSDVYHHWWPQPTCHYGTLTYQTRPNATEMAFKIVTKLMQRGTVPDLTVKEFVELVDDVALIVRES